MRQLSLERKKYLLESNRQVKQGTLSRSSNARSQTAQASGSIGPAVAAGILPRLVPQITGDQGLMKRFSMSGWTGSIGPAAGATVTPSSSESGRRTSEFMQPVSPIAESLKPVASQSTGGLWSSLWASSGGAASDEKSPKGYATIVRTAKMDIKLVKNLISLRVHLSTAHVDWIEEFVDIENGLDILGDILATLVGKGGKRKKLTDTEASVLLEVVKCLRVLLNTEVSFGASISL
jgi:diaphanous 1